MRIGSPIKACRWRAWRDHSHVSMPDAHEIAIQGVKKLLTFHNWVWGTLLLFFFIQNDSVTVIIITSQSYPTYALQLTATSARSENWTKLVCWWSGPQPWEGRAPLSAASIDASAVMALVGMSKIKKRSSSVTRQPQPAPRS